MIFNPLAFHPLSIFVSFSMATGCTAVPMLLFFAAFF
jgi:hypothetical protein